MKRYASFKELRAEGVFSNWMDPQRKIAAGFPAPLEFGPNTVRWDRDEVEAWIQSRPRRHLKNQPA